MKFLVNQRPLVHKIPIASIKKRDQEFAKRTKTRRFVIIDNINNIITLVLIVRKLVEYVKFDNFKLEQLLPFL